MRRWRILELVLAVSGVTVWSAQESEAWCQESVANGEIQVDADFPGGNIEFVRIDGDTVHVRQALRDTDGWWFWWHFRLRGAAGRSLYVQFTAPSPIGPLGPAYRLGADGPWTWLGAEAVSDSRFRFAVPHAAHEVWFAFAMPYQQADLHRFLDDHQPHVAAGELRVDTLCRSPQGHAVPLWRMGPGSANPPRRRLLLTARHHACETMASYVLEGVVRELLSTSEAGQWMREHVEVIVVPLVDYDGVERGDQGKNRIPRDHNRDYDQAARYPETLAIQRLAQHWSSDCSTVAVDLHCPWIRGPHNDVIYMVGSSVDHIAAEQRVFGALLEQNRRGPLPYRTADDLPFGSGWNTGENYQQGTSFARWASGQAGVRLATTFEVPYAEAGGETVTPDSARAFGRDLAVALADYLRQTPLP